MIAFRFTSAQGYALLAALTTIVVAWIAWRRPRRSRVEWRSDPGRSIVTRTHERLRVFFDDVPIDSLSLLTLYISNVGPERVNQGDTEVAMSLTFDDPEVKIVDIDVVPRSALDSVQREPLSRGFAFDVAPLDPGYTKGDLDTAYRRRRCRIQCKPWGYSERPGRCCERGTVEEGPPYQGIIRSNPHNIRTY